MNGTVDVLPRKAGGGEIDVRRAQLALWLALLPSADLRLPSDNLIDDLANSPTGIRPHPTRQERWIWPPPWISIKKDEKETCAMSSSTTFPDRSVLVTGANRGIGRVLVEEALRRGGRRVYAGTRQPLAHPDDRVMPVILDVTNPAQIETSVEKVGSLDILINNAGISGAQIIPICTAPSTRTAAPSKYSCPVMRMHAALGAFDGVALVHDGAVHVTRAPH